MLARGGGTAPAVSSHMQTSLRLVPFIILLATTGCHNEQRTELDSATERWQQAGPGTSYEFTFRRSCNCSGDVTAPIRVTVTNGAITDAVYTADGSQATEAARMNVRTIGELFALIDDAIDSADDMRVTYDLTDGHPTAIDIDWESATADEETSIRVTDLAPTSAAAL